MVVVPGTHALVRQRRTNVVSIDVVSPALLTIFLGLPTRWKGENEPVKRTLAGSKWEVLRGYHILRHSFISCLAAAGVDQRIIDEFVGHQTDEQRRRYRHLIPDLKHKAIGGAFEE